MESVTRKAYGKINLSLDVTGRRADGYHLVRMVMQTVDIYDTVTIQVVPGNDIAISTHSREIPSGPDNLMWRAADCMRKAFMLEDGLQISIEKRIPVAAGMAGGSTDAAAVFCGLRDLYALPVSDEALEKLALPLGADIPYCIGGGTQLSEGIGEVLTRLPAAPDCSLIVVKPDLYVSTGAVYQAFDSIPPDKIRHPDVDGQVSAIRAGDLHRMAKTCQNVLEQKTGAAHPVIGELEQFFLERGALTSIMTGSGPAVYAVYEDREQAARAFRELQSVGQYQAFQKFLTGFQ